MGRENSQVTVISCLGGLSLSHPSSVQPNLPKQPAMPASCCSVVSLPQRDCKVESVCHVYREVRARPCVRGSSTESWEGKGWRCRPAMPCHVCRRVCSWEGLRQEKRVLARGKRAQKRVQREGRPPLLLSPSFQSELS